jgi:sugar phosphate isomerase/epimerase
MKRSEFILSGAAALASVAFNQQIFCAGKLKKNYGIQLYSLRDVFAKDPINILAQLSSFGYKYVESYEGPNGIYWGFGADGFKKRLDDLGMKLTSAHCDTGKEFEKKIEESARIGMSYLINPWIGKQKTLDDYKRTAENFNQYGERCKKAGIKFAYHNHDYSFRLHDNAYPQDILMQHTDSSLVDFEMDIYWVVTAGQNPVTWLNKYPGRFKLCHIKDRSLKPVKDEGENSTDLGCGSIAFDSILRVASLRGMQHFIYEQESYPYGSSLEAAKTAADFMNKLKI